MVGTLSKATCTIFSGRCSRNSGSRSFRCSSCSSCGGRAARHSGQCKRIQKVGAFCYRVVEGTTDDWRIVVLRKAGANRGARAKTLCEALARLTRHDMFPDEGRGMSREMSRIAGVIALSTVSCRSSPFANTTHMHRSRCL